MTQRNHEYCAWNTHPPSKRRIRHGRDSVQTVPVARGARLRLIPTFDLLVKGLRNHSCQAQVRHAESIYIFYEISLLPYNPLPLRLKKQAEPR